MEALRELVQLVTRNKLKSIDILDMGEVKDSKLGMLYEIISEGKVESDQAAAAELYPDADNTSGYRKLKNKLRKKLINSLLVVDLNKASYSDRKSAYYLCYQEWAAVRILLAKNAWAQCVKTAERILKYAIKYEFTELALDLISILRLHYGARIGDLKQFEEYKSLSLEYEAIFMAENKAELLYTELIVHYVNNRSVKTNLKRKTELALLELSDSMRRYSSYRLHLYGGMIGLMASSIVNNHEDTIQTCEEIISFFEAKSYRAETPLQAAYYQKLICHCQLRQFEPGRKAAEQCLVLIEEGIVNWFKYYEMYFILAMHTENYQEALNIYYKVTNHKRFRYLPNNVTEIWLIYEAYLHYLFVVGLLIPSKEQKSLEQFRLGRFLNEAAIYSKDKSGLNIAIIIFQIIYLMATNQYDKLLDREEAIEKYCTRHLKEEYTMRSYYFIRGLLIMASLGVNNGDRQEKAEAYRAKLLEEENLESSQVFQIEVIPFEQLWEIALKNHLG